MNVQTRQVECGMSTDHAIRVFPHLNGCLSVLLLMLAFRNTHKCTAVGMTKPVSDPVMAPEITAIYH